MIDFFFWDEMVGSEAPNDCTKNNWKTFSDVRHKLFVMKIFPREGYIILIVPNAIELD